MAPLSDDNLARTASKQSPISARAQAKSLQGQRTQKAQEDASVVQHRGKMTFGARVKGKFGREMYAHGNGTEREREREKKGTIRSKHCVWTRDHLSLEYESGLRRAVELPRAFINNRLEMGTFLVVDLSCFCPTVEHLSAANISYTHNLQHTCVCFVAAASQ